MKRLLLICGLFALLSVPAFGQAFVQANNCADSTTAKACSVSITTTLGNAIVVCAVDRLNATDTVAITDSASQTGYVQTASGYVSVSSRTKIGCFIRPNSAALTSVTCTWTTGGTTDINCVVAEFSGLATSSAEDSSVNNSQSVAGTTATSGSLTTTNANDACIFYVGVAGPVTAQAAGANYTLPTNGAATRSFINYRIVSATQSGVTTTATWTSSVADTNIFACFKGAAGGAAPAGANKRRKLESLDPPLT